MTDGPPLRSGARMPAHPAGEWWALAAGIAGVTGLSLLYARVLHVGNAATAALSLLLIVLLIAAVSTLRAAVLVSILATAAFNFFFLPPVGTLTIADPTNWVALGAFLTVAVVASQLSSNARRRAQESAERRGELARLFDLSRDILIATDSRDAIGMLSLHVARRFGLDYAAICLPGPAGWQVHDSGAQLTLEAPLLERAMAASRGVLEFDARERTYGGHRSVTTPEGATVWLVPLRLGTRATGLLGASGPRLEPGTLDAVAGIAAIAIERANLLDERRQAALAQQGAELKSALLASLSHDLRTPLTAIAVAAGNLQAGFMDEAERQEQTTIVLTEVERLKRLFQNIVDMARIETKAVAAEAEWTTPADIVVAAVAQVEPSLRDHPLDIQTSSTDLVQVDPRLTAAALAHLLENAAQYSPEGAAIDVRGSAGAEGLRLVVRDRGTGIDPTDLEHLFTRFYRGARASEHPFGTGMGLAITRGLLTAEGGRVWAENHPGGGAQFTIVVPASVRRDLAAAASSPTP